MPRISYDIKIGNKAGRPRIEKPVVDKFYNIENSLTQKRN